MTPQSLNLDDCPACARTEEASQVKGQMSSKVYASAVATKKLLVWFFAQNRLNGHKEAKIYSTLKLI